MKKNTYGWNDVFAFAKLFQIKRRELGRPLTEAEVDDLVSDLDRRRRDEFRAITIIAEKVMENEMSRHVEATKR